MYRSRKIDSINYIIALNLTSAVVTERLLTKFRMIGHFQTNIMWIRLARCHDNMFNCMLERSSEHFTDKYQPDLPLSSIHIDAYETLQCRHNESDFVPNHQRLHCLLKCLFRRRSKKISKLRVTSLSVGNSPVTSKNSSHKKPVTRKMFDDVIMKGLLVIMLLTVTSMIFFKSSWRPRPNYI